MQGNILLQIFQQKKVRLFLYFYIKILNISALILFIIAPEIQAKKKSKFAESRSSTKNAADNDHCFKNDFGEASGGKAVSSKPTKIVDNVFYPIPKGLKNLNLGYKINILYKSWVGMSGVRDNRKYLYIIHIKYYNIIYITYILIIYKGVYYLPSF